MATNKINVDCSSDTVTITNGYITAGNVLPIQYPSTTTTTGYVPNYGTTTTRSITIKGSDMNPFSINFDEASSLQSSYKDIFEKMFNTKIKEPNYIYKIEEIKPEKVYRFTFGDDTKVKTICSGVDIFDLRYACFLAVAKKLYSKILTFEGVINESYQLMYYKEYNKMIDKAIKKFYKEQEEKAKEEEAKRISKRKHDKLVARKIAKKERERQKQVNIIKEAIIAAKEEE